MKKALVILVVLALCVPAMAATVVITDNADGTGTITVTADGAVNIVGLALDIDVTAGGNITACALDAASVAAGFNIHMDAAHDEEAPAGDGYVYGEGTALADQDAVGEVAVSNSFAISVGALNGESTAGATGAASVTIDVTVDADTTIAVQENALRGGIILTDGTGEDITGTPVSGDITKVSDKCFTRYYAEGTPQYTAWVNQGEPDCWCFDGFQCGDSNGDCAIDYGNDVTAVILAWPASGGTYNPCADFNYDEAIDYGNDVTVLVNHWPANPGAGHVGGVAGCIAGTCPTAVGIETDGSCDPVATEPAEALIDGNDD